MTTLRLVKTNGRDLTKEEEAEIAAWWPANPDESIDAVIAHFEAKFETSITQTRVLRIMLQHEGVV